MRNQIANIIAKKGYTPVFESINKSIQDLKNAKYTKEEIRETVTSIFGIDQKIISFINSKI